MLPAFLRERLSNKVILATLSLLATILVSTNYFAVREEERADLEELEARTTQLAASSAMLLAPVIEQGRYRDLDEYVQRLVDGTRDLAMLRILSMEGLVLAQYPPEGSGDARLEAASLTRQVEIPRSAPLEEEEPETDEEAESTSEDETAAEQDEASTAKAGAEKGAEEGASEDEEEAAEEDAELAEGEEEGDPRAKPGSHPTLLGKLTLASSLQSLELGAVARQRAAGLEIGLVLIGTCVLLLVFLKRRLDEPLAGIAAEAVELGRGKLNRPLRWKGDDEIGTLADALERMRKNLLELHKKNQEQHERALENARLKELYVTEVCAELLEPAAHLLSAASASPEVTSAVEAPALRIQTRLNQVLAHARQSSGAETALRAEPVDVHAQSESWLERLRFEAELHSLELVNEVAAGTKLTTDPDLLDQIVVNLLDNAARTTKRGRITLAARLLDKDAIILQVADTGTGVPLELQQKLFEKDQRGFAAHARQYQGTWIGLLVARRSVEALGGVMHLDNTPGIGSCFSVALPLRRGVSVDSLREKLRQQTTEEIRFEDDMSI
ncbi:MAG: HAMP domain-containing histidine kinase [Planctomycetes bacterium]|nr:HAMP domain-containing histidine kinase [Planctomycetota bacterium]